MIVKEQIDFWNSLPEEEQNKEVMVCGLTVEEVMKLKIERENLKEENRQLKNEVDDLHGYCTLMQDIKTEVYKLFKNI